MTHEERLALLRQQTQETISPAMLAQIIGGDPYAYNVAARDGKLTLPHVWRGRNLRIFRQPILDMLSGKAGANERDD